MTIRGGIAVPPLIVDYLIVSDLVVVLINARNNGAIQISCSTYRVGSPPMPDTVTNSR